MTTIRHPMQDVRVRVMCGQYAGRTGKVLCVLMGYGAHGFAKIEFDDGKGQTKECDLVPMQYVDRSGVRQC
ncbi:MAG TPA: hypothetical protein VGL08_06765 [Paraburkholderia sp.]|jgi:hypothetical protein